MTEIRTVTRPDIKWLANELAATSGGWSESTTS